MSRAEELLKITNKIVLRNRNIVREGKRFKIYLDTTNNDLWEYLYQTNKKVDVVIIVRD